MRFKPQSLQLGVVVRTKLVSFQYLIQILEVASVKGHDGLGFQHGFVVVEFITGR